PALPVARRQTKNPLCPGRANSRRERTRTCHAACLQAGKGRVFLLVQDRSANRVVDVEPLRQPATAPYSGRGSADAPALRRDCCSRARRTPACRKAARASRFCYSASGCLAGAASANADNLLQAASISTSVGYGVK